MAVKIVNYNNNKLYVGPSQQPFATIVLVGTPRVSIAQVLVDTGADHILIPLTAARSAGLNVASGTPVPVRTAGGQINLILISGVPVEVEGIPITTEVLCHPQSTIRPLLGRSALRKLSDVGFDATHWLW